MEQNKARNGPEETYLDNIVSQKNTGFPKLLYLTKITFLAKQ